MKIDNIKNQAQQLFGTEYASHVAQLEEKLNSCRRTGIYVIKHHNIIEHMRTYA